MPGSETRAAVGSSSLIGLSSVIIAGSYISDHRARYTSGGNALRWGVGACPLSRRVLGQRPGPDGGTSSFGAQGHRRLRSCKAHGGDADSLYGRGIAKVKSGDAEAGNADIAAAKAVKSDIADAHAGDPSGSSAQI